MLTTTLSPLGRFIQARTMRIAERLSSPRNLRGLVIFRWMAGLNLLSEYLVLHHQRHLLLGNHGIFPYSEYMQISHVFSLYWLAPTRFSFDIAYHVSILCIALWTWGWKTRWTTPAVLLCWTSIQDRNPALWDGGDNLMTLLLIYSCFMYLTPRGSVAARSHRAAMVAPALGIVHNVALVAFALQVCTVYFVAGLIKASGSTWADGSALYLAMVDQEFFWPTVSPALYTSDAVLSIVGPLTVFFQIAMPFLFLLNRHSRLFVLILAILFHVSIGLFLGLVSFAIYFIAAELALISDSHYETLDRGLQRCRGWLLPILGRKRIATAS